MPGLERVPTSVAIIVDSPSVNVRRVSSAKAALCSFDASSDETINLVEVPMDLPAESQLDEAKLPLKTPPLAQLDEDPPELEEFLYIPEKDGSIEQTKDHASSTKSSTGQYLRSLLGVFLGLTSGFTNSLVALLVKLIETIGTFEIAVFRYVVMLVPLILTLGFKKTNPFRPELIKTRGWVLVLRAVLGSASTYGKYYALKRLPLADASVILFSSPVFASILGRIFLKEKFHVIHGVAILFTLTGCALVSRPTFIFGAAAYNPDVEWDDHMWGCLAALASSVFTASVYVTVRQMRDVDSTIVLFYTAFVGLIISLAATAVLDHFIFPTDPWEISYLLGVGILTLISQEALTRALRLESAGLISLLRTGDIVWSFIWQITLFKVIPHYLSIIGALLVVFCVSFISLREAAVKLPPDSKLAIVVRKVDRWLDSLTSVCTCCCRKKVQPPENTTESVRLTISS